MSPSSQQAVFAASPEPIIMPLTSESAGMSHSVYAYPTGNIQNSVMLIERIAPSEVQLRERFDYKINISNLTDDTWGARPTMTLR